MEDDSAGELLEVLWDLEVDAKVWNPATRLISKGWTIQESLGLIFMLYDGTASHRRTWILQSPFRAGIDLKPYQLEPLRKALSLPRVNLFIADDVGLGKTVEAGLVMQEMV